MSTVNPLRLFEELSASLDEKAARAVAKAIGDVYDQLANQVTRDDFQSLRATVEELSRAQTRTEKRLVELAEAQARTEKALDALTQRVDRLSSALEVLTQRMDGLAEAQGRTEKALEALARRMDGLAEAEAQTRAELKRTTRQVGGLSVDVGYLIEDRVFPYVVDFAQREFDLELSVLDRRSIEYPDGRFDEINIYAEGMRGGSRELLIGEAKAQPGKHDADRFAQEVSRVAQHAGLPVRAFFVGHHLDPEVKRYFHEHYPEIRFVPTYDFELHYERRRLA